MKGGYMLRRAWFGNLREGLGICQAVAMRCPLLLEMRGDTTKGCPSRPLSAMMPSAPEPDLWRGQFGHPGDASDLVVVTAR